MTPMQRQSIQASRMILQPRSPFMMALYLMAWWMFTYRSIATRTEQTFWHLTMLVMVQVTQGHHSHGHDGGHQPLDSPAGEGPGHVVTAPGAPVHGHQHRGAQAGHQGQHRVRQGKVSDEQDRQAACGHLAQENISSVSTMKRSVKICKRSLFCWQIVYFLVRGNA